MPDPASPPQTPPIVREKFRVRLVVNVEVEAEHIPGGDPIGLAQSCAEVVAAQVLVQGTRNVARTMPGQMTVTRVRKGGRR